MMNPTGLAMFLFLGLSTRSHGATREYHFVNLSKTWSDAQSYCREHFDDLATVENQEDWTTVKNSFLKGKTFAWLGLHYRVTPWKWSVDNTNLYTDGNIELGDWFSFIADNFRGNDECITFNKKILWDTNCYSKKKSVCYDESTKTYIGVTDEMTWWSAQSYCREKYTDLATVKSQQEQEEILKLIDQTAWWIGLSRRLWHWSDQTDSIFRAWNQGSPSSIYEHYVVADYRGWHDVDGTRRYPFICSVVPMMKLVKFVLKPEGPVDMNDPLVQEAMRKQIEKLMKDGGIQKFRLTWRKQPNGKTFNKV